MDHPDQHTPDDHRSSTRQSAPKPNADPNIEKDLGDDALEADADTGPNVRTPEPDENRQGEAGNTYAGRQMDDRLKSNPRVEDADEVIDDEATEE